MPNEEQLSPAARELERQLAALPPAKHTMERDALMFRAGQRTALRRLHRWQVGTGVIVVAMAAGLLSQAWLGPSPRESALATSGHHQERPPQPIPRVEPASPLRPHGERSGAADYLRLRSDLIADGLDALPSATLAAGPAGEVLSVADWRRQTFLAQPMTRPQMPN